MATELDNVEVVVNADLARAGKSKSIKTKPKTFTGTKNYYLDNLNLELNKESTLPEL